MQSDQCEQNRELVIARANIWKTQGIKYKFHAYYVGYRTQCSGYLSFAWNLKQDLKLTRTPRCYDLEPKGIAQIILKEDLKKGDAMVCNHKKYKVTVGAGEQGGGHCLIFERWANEDKTSYIGWELCNDATCKGVTRREIPYPYFYKTNCWEPMRYIGLNCDSQQCRSSF